MVWGRGGKGIVFEKEDADEKAVKEARMASKLDHVFMEYNEMLMRTLDSQRSYYEGDVT